MLQRKHFLIAGFALLVLFYLFSAQVKKGRFQQLNFDTTVRLQDKMPKRFDSYWEDITFFAEPGPSIVIALGLTAVASYDLKKKKFRPGAVSILFLFGLVVFAEIYGKAKVESAAPPFFMLKNPTTIFPKFFVQEQYSYPSGHAARSLFFGITTFYLAWRYTKKWQNLAVVGLIVGGCVAVISVGKVYLGQHWLSDIIGGYLLALACSSFLGMVLWEK